MRQCAFLIPIAAGFLWARRRDAGSRAIGRTRSRAIVPRELDEAPRHLAAAIARRARDAVR